MAAASNNKTPMITKTQINMGEELEVDVF